ncbi:MAG TPA: glycosyltransferase family 4 protein [Steroidobacteraceae bacterium]|nr:glycosyltransferase family 4 protein [Steroidobacteraceae bacterium]
MSKPSVLFVGAFPRPGLKVYGGMVTSCQALLASSLPGRLHLDLLDSTQISNPPPALPTRFGLALVRFARFLVKFEKCRPQAVILFAALGASIVEKGVMARYARWRGVPSLIFPRAGHIVDACRDSPLTRAWARLSFRGASKLVCQSVSWSRFATETLGFAPEHVSVVRNWTASPELLAVGERRRRRAGSRVELLFVGWLERDKGILDLIRACAAQGPCRVFRLVIVGDGGAAHEARELAAQLGLAASVEFRGWLQTEELRAALRDADVFVLPSWAEGLPNAMVEAMAARVAVLVTAVGAIPEVIVDRENGLLVPPRDAAALARALGELIDDGALRARLADEAFEVAKREFSPEAAVDRLVALIDASIAGGEAAGPAVRGH